MHGFLDGLTSAYGAVQSFIGGAGGAVSSGVAQWAGLVAQALTELGQPQSAEPAVLRRMQRESGGNPTIQNLTDSNAIAGYPSTGLMQTIAPTFYAYAGQYSSRGITDPYANIYAGISYAMARYGAGWIGRMDAGGGYDTGGWLPRGMSVAMNNTAAAERVLGPHDELSLSDATLNRLAHIIVDVARGVSNGAVQSQIAGIQAGAR